MTSGHCNRVVVISLSLALVGMATGCASRLGPMGGDDFTPTPPPVAPPPTYENGSLYSSAHAVSLFEDLRARRIGDVITVVLNERTDANKSASTATSKDSTVSLAPGTAFGRPITDDGVPIAEAALSGEREFEGAGTSSQSNQLNGSITVSVVDVLPNGLLVVQGEKWIQINQGREYVRVRGLVRPVDISALNTVSSSQIANAQIAYGGSGALADANREGWLARFFSSVVWPF